MELRSQALVVVKNPQEMTDLFPLWPEPIGLVVCLLEDGRCILSAFHDEETEFLPERLVKQLRLTPEEVCFYPKVKGFGTHTLPFSDEQALATLILGSSGLLEEAEDYLANYEFAVDEHLDPTFFLQREGPRSSEAPEPLFTTHGSTLAEALENRNMHRPDAPQFKARFSVKLHRESKEWIIFENLQEGKDCLIIGDRRQIFLRDDRKAIALHLGKEHLDLQAPPKRIQIHAKLVSKHVGEFLLSKNQAVELTRDGEFLYFSTLPSQGAPHSPDPRILESLKADDIDKASSRGSKANESSPTPRNSYNSAWIYVAAFTVFGALFSAGISLGVNSLQVGSSHENPQFFGNISLLMTELGFLS